MTELSKTVRRRTRGAYPVGKGCRAVPLILTLEPGDLVGVRECRRRESSRLTIEADDLYRLLHRLAAEARRARPCPVSRGKLRQR